MNDWKDALSALTGVSINNNATNDNVKEKAKSTSLSHKKRQGIVYSTNQNFAYTDNGTNNETETIAPQQQKLRIRIERAGRGGKTVTIVSGFIGTNADLQTLCKLLKQKCGVGGSTKDGDIIMQGNLRTKLKDLLIKEGYTQTK